MQDKLRQAAQAASPEITEAIERCTNPETPGRIYLVAEKIDYRAIKGTLVGIARAFRISDPEEVSFLYAYIRVLHNVFRDTETRLNLNLVWTEPNTQRSCELGIITATQSPAWLSSFADLPITDKERHKYDI